MIDGFKIVIGGQIVNMVVVVAMVIAIGLPPTYEDDNEKTTLALCTYIYLILYHIVQSAVSWCLILGISGAGSITTWMMLTVITIVIVIQRWIYTEVVEDYSSMSDKQKAWYVWCWIEVAYFFSTIIGAALFTFIRTWTPAISYVSAKFHAHKKPDKNGLSRRLSHRN